MSCAEWTPLWLSLLNADYQLAALLVDHGADVTTPVPLRHIRSAAKTPFRDDASATGSAWETARREAKTVVTPVEYALTVGAWTCALGMLRAHFADETRRRRPETTTGNELRPEVLLKLVPCRSSKPDDNDDGEDIRREICELMLHTRNRM